MDLDLGAEGQLMKAHAAQNARGFWEHQEFVRLNDRILQRAGGKWDDPPKSVECSPGFVAQAKRLAESFSASSLRGWKDPRMCLTMPVWNATGVNLRAVVSIRHPIEVASSLQKRNGMSTKRGIDLWRRHYRGIIKHTQPENRVCVHYANLIVDWRSAIEPVREFIPELRMDRSSEIDEFLTTDLQHHTTAEEISDEDRDILRMLGAP
jgi:hypothetical protein